MGTKVSWKSHKTKHKNQSYKKVTCIHILASYIAIHKYFCEYRMHIHTCIHSYMYYVYMQLNDHGLAMGITQEWYRECENCGHTTYPYKLPKAYIW